MISTLALKRLAEVYYAVVDIQREFFRSQQLMALSYNAGLLASAVRGASGRIRNECDEGRFERALSFYIALGERNHEVGQRYLSLLGEIEHARLARRRLHTRFIPAARPPSHQPVAPPDEPARNALTP